jgi:transcription elongation factor GreA
VRPDELHGEAITPAGLEALQAELEQLETVGRRRMAERILAARELGDLKENAEYHIAKDDQAHLETRIKRLRERLRIAVVVEADAQAATLAFGRTAEVRDEETGKVHTWTIVGPTEGNLADGKLSSESPVASALLGRSPGDVVEVQTPRGPRKYRVEKLVG